MALDDDEQRYFRRMWPMLHGTPRTALERRDAYYEGSQRIENLGIAIPPELELFLTVVNWPRIAVDSVEERLDVTGFRTGTQEKGSAGATDPDDKDSEKADADLDEKAADLWRIWQANDLDSEAPLVHLDTLVLTSGFIVVGSNDDDEDTPLITVESAYDMAMIGDPRSPRNGEAALKLYREDGEVGPPTAATLWTREQTIELERDSQGRWTDVERADNDFGLLPVTRLMNGQRLRKRQGRSEIDDIMSLTDAAARSLTNLQVAAETHAVPARGVIGATKGDFIDASSGRMLTTWESYFGAYNAITNEKASIFQFSASDLRNFHDTTLHYARLVSALTGLPPHYLGFGAEQPPSAEAIKSVEARLVKRCERKQVAFGAAWERTMYLVQLMIGQVKEDDPQRGMLEVLWRDAGTPTQAQVDDGAVKKKQAGILSTQGAMEMTGMSQVAIRRELRRLKAEQAQAAELDPITGLASKMRAPGQVPGQPGQGTTGGTPGANPATSPAAQGRSSTAKAA